MIKAVQAGEDQKFLNHWGFDFESMKKAYYYNKKRQENSQRRHHIAANGKKCFYGLVVHIYEKFSKHILLF